MEMYTALRDRHIADVTSAYGRLRIEAAKIEENREDLTALREIKNKVATHESRHQILAEAYLDFLQRANTAESLEDSTKFKTILADHKQEITNIVTSLQTLVTRLIEQKEQSTTSSSSTSATRKRAAANAAKKRLEYARKENEVKLKKAALEAELDLLSHEKEAAVAEVEAEVYERATSGFEEVEAEMPNLPTEDEKMKTAAYVEELPHQGLAFSLE